MRLLRKNLQALAAVLALALVVVVGVAAANDSTMVAAWAGVPVVAIVVVLTAHIHQRVGDTMREVLRGQKEVDGVARAQDETHELLRAHRDDWARQLDDRADQREELIEGVVAAVQRHFLISQGQLTARLDAVEDVLRSLAKDLERGAAELDERGRTIARMLESHNYEIDASWRESFEEVMGAVSSTSDDTQTALALLGKLQHEPITEIDAMLQLHRRFPLEGEVPLMWGWALSPRALLQSVELVLEPSCTTVVECGSGTSTVFLGRALQRSGGGRLVALEHLPEMAEATERQVRRHGLDDVVDVRLAELRPVSIGDDTYAWYDTAALADIEEVDFVLVDGPTGATGVLSRYPAFPLLRSQLTPGAVIALDDAQRPDEHAILSRWMAEDAGLNRQRSMTAALALMRWEGEPHGDPRTGMGNLEVAVGRDAD